MHHRLFVVTVCHKDGTVTDRYLAATSAIFAEKAAKRALPKGDAVLLAAPMVESD